LHMAVEVNKQSLVSVILGAQWGDEGKGKIVDLLAPKVDIVARCQGGHNAGHTVAVDDKVYDFHIIPSGIVHPRCIALIGSGTVVHLPSFFNELEKNEITKLPDWSKRIVISDRAHLVFDMHQIADTMGEKKRANSKIGTTGKGIGPTYACKCWRNGIRLGDLVGNFNEFKSKFQQLVLFLKAQFPDLNVDVDEELKRYQNYAEKLKSLNLVHDTVFYMHKALTASPAKSVLVEGANGALLDIDFGTYPYVTSSNCSVGGALTGLGIPPWRVGMIIGEIGDRLREIGHEYGVTTGRPRRCGWLDMVLLKYSIMINGFTHLAFTKLDVLDNFDTIKVAVEYKRNNAVVDAPPICVSQFKDIEVVYETFPGWQQSTTKITTFDELPINAKCYVQAVEKLAGVPTAQNSTFETFNLINRIQVQHFELAFCFSSNPNATIQATTLRYLSRHFSSSVALTPSEVEMLKQFKDCDLPKGTRVGRMVMGDLGLYNEQLRKDVERWNKAIEAGIPVHEWNGTSDKIVNTFMHLFGFIIFLNILLQLYALLVDPKILDVVDRMLFLKKNEKPQEQ
ncbi:Adenylosuccinate synthetase, partial [Trichinella papuae]